MDLGQFRQLYANQMGSIECVRLLPVLLGSADRAHYFSRLAVGTSSTSLRQLMRIQATKFLSFLPTSGVLV